MSWHLPHFDSHQFAHRPHAVSAESRISYEDFRTMHVDTAVVRRERRLETPAWVAGNALREVIVRYLERRLYLPPSTAPMQERLDAIQRRAESVAAEKQARLESYMRQYAALVKEPEADNATRLRGIERQIVTLDGDLALLQRGLAATICAIVYLFHRAAWDGSQIAEHLGLKQQHVRQVLFRLNRAASPPAKGLCKGNKFSARPRSPEVRAAISARLKGNTNGRGNRGKRHFAQEVTGDSR